MEKIIREHGESEDIAEDDVREAVELATALGKIVDEFGIFHFFIVLDAIGLIPSRDTRMAVIYEMAQGAHRVLARDGDDRKRVGTV
jgi:hypothetical protein